MSKRTLTVSGVAIAAGLIGAAMAPATAQAAVPAKAGASVSSSGTVYYAAKLADGAVRGQLFPAHRAW
jgi:hypothetical protein